MSNFTVPLTEDLYRYLLSVSVRETAVQKALAAETLKQTKALMQITPYQGQFMRLLVELTGAKRIVEIGVFTGYSSLAMALSLPDNGKIIACDISEEWTNIAKKYWQQAGVSHKIELHLKPALLTLETIDETIDLVFIDADKVNYQQYYEAIIDKVKQNGLILFDNTLWDGKVADTNVNDEDTVALRQLNDFLFQDERVQISMLPIGDGLTIARKK